MGNDSLSEWMTHVRTVLCQNNPRKGSEVENCCPISYLPLMLKLLTGMIAEEMYDYLKQDKFCQKDKKYVDEEVVEQKINYLWIKLC